MMFVSKKMGFAISIGRDWRNMSGLEFVVAVGFREDAQINETPWRHLWRWSTKSLPKLIFRQFIWRGRRITVPVGYFAFGRCRIFWRQ